MYSLYIFHTPTEFQEIIGLQASGTEIQASSTPTCASITIWNSGFQ